MKVSENIIKSIKDTVGYAEAANKESFMVGATVAFSKSENFFKSEIELLQNQLVSYKAAYETTLNDMKIIVNTLNKYSDD